MLSGSFPIIALSNHTSFSQTQIDATVPLILSSIGTPPMLLKPAPALLTELPPQPLSPISLPAMPAPPSQHRHGFPSSKAGSKLGL
jgi:hypothetical protein